MAGHCSDARLAASEADLITAAGVAALFQEAAQTGSYTPVRASALHCCSACSRQQRRALRFLVSLWLSSVSPA
jgi:hypothetical protein